MSTISAFLRTFRNGLKVWSCNNMFTNPIFPSYVKPDYDWAFSNDAEVECFFNLNTSDLPVINDRIWGGSSKVICSTPTSDWKTPVPDNQYHGHSITKTPTLELAMAAAEASNVLRPITPNTPVKCHKMSPVNVTPNVKTEPLSPPVSKYSPDVKVKEEELDDSLEDFFSHEGEFSSPPPLVPVISPLKFSPQAVSHPTKPIIKCEVKLEKQPKEEPAEKRQILIKEENSISSSTAKRQILFTEETNCAKRHVLLKESIKSSAPKGREEVKRPYLIKEENKRRVLIKEENIVRMEKNKIMKRPRRKKPNTRDKGKTKHFHAFHFLPHFLLFFTFFPFLITFLPILYIIITNFSWSHFTLSYEVAVPWWTS